MGEIVNLQEIVRSLATKPGCYLFYNSFNQVLYVGKAKNLRNRVSTYFNKGHNYKTMRLVREIDHLETIITKTEKEALILEHNLIKQYRPKYNILLNDDKHYPYIIITKEQDPQYQYVRSLKKNYLRSYGPFPEGSHAREIIKILERLYPLRRCRGNLGKPCLYYHINQCSGACFKTVDKSYYDQQLKKVNNFFHGKSEEVKTILEQRMYQAAENLQFEEANKLKHLLYRLDWTLSSQTVEFLTKKDNLDVVGVFREKETLIITTLFYRMGKLSYKDYEMYPHDELTDEQEIIRLYLQNIYQKNIVPERVILDESIELVQVQLLFGEHFFHPRNKKEKGIIKLAQENGYETYLQYELSRQHKLDKTKILIELQTLLNLPEIPYQIEMIDIANLQNEFVTGGVITYKNGAPSRNDYRRYNINISAQDDSHRIAYVVERRYSKLITENKPLPNLIVMDGGLQQVNACERVLKTLNLQIPVIGLVKNDKHRTEYLLDQTKVKVKLDKQSPLFLFLTRMQDTVHQFTISSFRTRKTKALIVSVLEQVKGLGKTKIKLLNTHFDNITAMQNASFEQLNDIIKNKTTTAKLQEFLTSNDLKS